MINILPILEAKDSSRIENIVTTSDQLFQYIDHQVGADPATKEALRYRTALYDDYYTLLRKVTEEGEWGSWILFMLKAVESTSQWTTSKILSIRQLMEETTDYVRENLPKIYTYELIQILFMQPYCRIDNLVQHGVAKRQTASIYLKQLVEIGVLEEMSVGREKLYLNTKLLQELNQ